GLASRDIANVLRVGQHQLKVPLQQMPDRFPVHPRRLHRDMGDPMGTQPLVELKQRRSGGSKGPYLIMRRLCDTADAGNHTVLVDIQPGASRIQYFHRYSSPIGIEIWPREKPWLSKSNMRAPERKRSWQQFGVLAGSRVQLANGLRA